MPALKKNDTLTVGQVARLCRVAPRTVSKWMDRGLIPHYRLPRNAGDGAGDRRARKEDVITFMRTRGIPFTPTTTVVATPDPILGRELGKYPDVRVAPNTFEAIRMVMDETPRCVVVDCYLGRTLAMMQVNEYKDRGMRVVAIVTEDEGMEADFARADAVLRRPVGATQIMGVCGG